ncbi:hypothetical protein Tco_0302001, partial [Tanacetum coccineum]
MGCFGLSDFQVGKRYRGDGEVGIGEGELGSVLGRWFGSRNHGGERFEFGGKVVM